MTLWRVIGVEDWAEVRRLRRVEGVAISAIARRLGIARNTVKKALASDGPPKYVRDPKGSIVDAVEPAVRELLRTTPDMPATVIAERIGWDRSITVLKDRVRELRPYYLPVDPATRTTYDPGQRVQCDLWFPPAPIPLGFGQEPWPRLPDDRQLTPSPASFEAAAHGPARAASAIAAGAEGDTI